MAIADPISLLNGDGTAVASLVRITSNIGGVYQYTTDSGAAKYTISVRNDATSSTSVNRYSIVYTHDRLLADALVPSTNKWSRSTATLSVVVPKVGPTSSQNVAHVTQLLATIRANTDLIITKILNGEV